MREKRPFEVIESRQMDHLQMFHKVARALTQALELEDILLIIMDQMAEFFGPQQWSLLMVDEEAQELYYAIAVGEDTDSLKGLRVPIGGGFAGMVAKSGTPLVVPDVSLDKRWSAFARANPDLNIQSIACVPVNSGTKTLGVIQLLNSKLDLLSDYSVSFLRILCDYAAIAIQNAKTMTLIQKLSITDDCTGLFNSRHLYSLLEEQIAQATGDPKLEFSLVFLDLDHFKQVNDTHGHLVGSRLLAEVGNLMKRVLGPENSCFRYGGDEFVALLPGQGKATAIATTLHLWEELRKEEFLGGQNLHLKIAGSFGLATFPEDGNTLQGVIRAADTMMYSAKTTRDNVAVAGLGLLAGAAPPPPVVRTHVPATMAAADLEALRR